jgi:Bacterial regulatory helix-turn-helix protein, lysR family
MIDKLEYLMALAREEHFGRAAEVCGVTQPTLSAGIKQLEESLGVLTVERGQRFLGLTAEGERVLAWAQRVLVDYGGLQQELGEMREGLVGQLRIGAIPVTLPIVPLLTAPFTKRHQRTDIVVISQTSISIQRGLDEAGVPRNSVYDATMYVLAAMLVGGFVCNYLIKPLADKWFMKDEEVVALQAQSQAAATRGSMGIGEWRLNATSILAWLAVGLPIAAGAFGSPCRTRWCCSADPDLLSALANGRPHDRRRQPAGWCGSYATTVWNLRRFLPG